MPDKRPIPTTSHQSPESVDLTTSHHVIGCVFDHPLTWGAVKTGKCKPIKIKIIRDRSI